MWEFAQINASVCQFFHRLEPLQEKGSKIYFLPSAHYSKIICIIIVEFCLF